MTVQCTANFHRGKRLKNTRVTRTIYKQAVGGRPPRYAPPLSSPRGRRSASRGRADDNVAAVSHGQHVPMPTAAAAWRANTAVSNAAWWSWPLTFWPWKWCPICDVGYLCANFGLPRPLYSRLRPDIRDRQTDRQTDVRQTSDVRQHHRLMPPRLFGGGGIIRVWTKFYHPTTKVQIKNKREPEFFA